MSGSDGQAGSARPPRPPVNVPWPLRRVDADKISPRLTRLWSARWPSCHPVGHQLRSCAADRWVRFHSLPGSKRYPDSAAEYAEMLRRHHVVLQDLLEQGSESDELTVIVGAWPDTDDTVDDRGLDPATTIPSEYWRSVLTDSDPDGWESWLDVFVTELDLTTPLLDTVLRLVADERLQEMIITDAELSWLYHPYDGGADVIAGTVSQRDRLVEAHRDWLSTHPRGL